MNQSMFYSVAAQLLMQAPHLLLYVAVVFLSSFYLRRLPLPATLAMAGGAILAFALLYGFALQFLILPQARMNFPMISILFYVRSFGHFIGESLLVAAILLGFSKASSVGFVVTAHGAGEDVRIPEETP